MKQDQSAARLHDMIAMACPIDSVVVNDPDDRTTWQIAFKSEATTEQQQAARFIFDAFANAAVVDCIKLLNAQVDSDAETQRLRYITPGDGMQMVYAEKFAQAHDHTFGYRSDNETLQIVSLKAVGRGIDTRPRVPERARRALEKTPEATRREAYFGPETGWHDTPVLPRSGLGAVAQSGPVIIEEYDTTIVVRPGWSARLDDWNNVVLEHE